MSAEKPTPFNSEEELNKQRDTFFKDAVEVAAGLRDMGFKGETSASEIQRRAQIDDIVRDLVQERGIAVTESDLHTIIEVRTMRNGIRTIFTTTGTYMIDDYETVTRETKGHMVRLTSDEAAEFRKRFPYDELEQVWRDAERMRLNKLNPPKAEE